ncbi:transposon Ty3-I Gag-Pol polyprotein [Trichonephila clavipes]|nr:transposon Ty3-I Gag-Pol polyprotein [Trichonephila clavipes]
MTLDTMLPFCPNDFDNYNITKIASRAEESRQLARVHTLRAQDKDRRRYDSKHQMVSYAARDLVWVYTPVRKVGLSEKLLRRYFGPYQVLRRLSAVTYEVQDFDPASRKRKLREVVHVLRMKPYHDPAEQIETEDKEIQDIIPPKKPYKGPITRCRIKILEQNDSGRCLLFRGEQCHTHNLLQVPTAQLAQRWTPFPLVLDESRSFFRVHTGYFSNIRSGSHKEIPITYGYTQDPFKNRSQNFKPKVKENYPQYLERENKNCFICGDSSHCARDCEKRFKPKESNDHIHNRINVNTLKIESEKQNSEECPNLQYVNIFVENQPVTALIDSGCQIPVFKFLTN